MMRTVLHNRRLKSWWSSCPNRRSCLCLGPRSDARGKSSGGARGLPLAASVPDGQAVMLTCGVPIAVDGSFTLPVVGDLLLIIGGFNLHRHAGKRLSRDPAGSARHFDIVAGVESGCWLLGRSGSSMAARLRPIGRSSKISARLFRIGGDGDRFVIDGKY
ncbi:hypothetical protein F2981_14770 [Sinorhizobium meliloti]|nr:hypothetical protein [Sinorhizobium meliloti]